MSEKTVKLYFDEYCPEEFRRTKVFREVIKNISFCELIEGTIINCIVVRKSVCPPTLPIRNGKHVCEITCIQSKYTISELREIALSEMFQTILFDVKIWVDKYGCKEFNYLCFNLTNSNMEDLYNAVIEKEIIKEEILLFGNAVYIPV